MVPLAHSFICFHLLSGEATVFLIHSPSETLGCLPLSPPTEKAAISHLSLVPSAVLSGSLLLKVDLWVLSHMFTEFPCVLLPHCPWMAAPFPLTAALHSLHIINLVLRIIVIIMSTATY